MLLVFLLLTLGHLTHGLGHPHHLWRVYNDIPGLGVLPEYRRLGASNNSEHDFHHVANDGGRIQFKYAGKAHDDHLAVLADASAATSIEYIECVDAFKLVFFMKDIEDSHRFMKRVQNYRFISGACISNGLQIPFYREIQTFYTETSEELLSVVFNTSNVAFQSLFDEISVSFSYKPVVAKQRRLNFFDDIDDLIDDVGDTFDNLGDTLKETWNDISNKVGDLFNGESIQTKRTIPIIRLNYNETTKSVLQSNLPLMKNSSLATCQECFLNVDAGLDFKLSFGALGIPESFHVVTGGNLAARVKLKGTLPEKGTRPFRTIIPQIRISEFKLVIMGVPILIAVDVRLRGGIETTESSIGDLYFGAEIHGNATYGASWTAQNDWQIQSPQPNWDFKYWLPEWDDFNPNHGSVVVTVVPDILVTMYEVVPILISPQVKIGASFGNETKNVHGSSSLTCTASDEAYTLMYGLGLELGVGDIKLKLNGIIEGADNVVFAHGRDFGVIDILNGFHAFPDSCGPLCSGCKTDYLKNKESYRQIALGDSAITNPDNDLSAGSIVGIIIGVVGACLLGVFAYKYWQKKQVKSVKASSTLSTYTPSTPPVLSTFNPSTPPIPPPRIESRVRIT